MKINRQAILEKMFSMLKDKGKCRIETRKKIILVKNGLGDKTINVEVVNRMGITEHIYILLKDDEKHLKYITHLFDKETRVELYVDARS